MEIENEPGGGRDWREERKRWREERRRRWDQKRKYSFERWENRGQSGKGNVWTGVFLLLIGVDYFLVENHIIADWMFSWETFLIAIGFFIGIRHSFHGVGWFILMLLGGAFLVKNHFASYFPGINFENIWPLVLILLGLFIIFRPRRRYWSEPVPDKPQAGEVPRAPEPASHEDYIDSTSIFGGTKKNIISKNFKGGDITNIMGGSEIDLSQADINGTITIDLTQVFGGTKLIVPSHWQVKTHMAAIFGGVEDKRSVQNSALDPNKTLILDGTSVFGGIEIRSY